MDIPAKQSVLIVDDEASTRTFLERLLKDHGFDTTMAADGREALKRASKQEFEVVLLDISMPKLNGFEVCRIIRERSNMPIIMLSASADEQDKVRCLRLGADDYLVKPFSTKELLARVNAILRRYQKHQGDLDNLPTS